MEGLFRQTSDATGLTDSTVHVTFIAVVAGLAAHQIFRKFEPTITDFFVTLLALQLLTGFISTAKATDSVVPVLFGVKQSGIFTLVYLSTLGISIGIYRAFLHPLRNYPGPLVPKLTKWAWFLGYRGGRYHCYLHKMHMKYGDVVRIGPRDIVFFNPDDVMIVNGPLSKFSKGPHSDGSPLAAAKSVTFVRERQEHRYRRRIWDQGFTAASLSSYEPRIAQLLETMTEKFRERSGTEINVTDWMSFFSFDSMGDLGFGKDFNMLATGTTHPYRESFHKAFKMRTVWMTMPWCKYIVPYIPVDQELKTCAKQFAKFSNEFFDARKALGQTRTDIFSHLLSQDAESGGKLTDAELREEAKAIILAGSDTTAFALVMILYNLVENPQAFAKVQKELDELHAKGPFKGTTLGPEQIPYVVGVINETLRLFPPGPGPTQRSNGPTPITVNGKYIPPNTNCYLCPWAMHHVEEYFSKAEEFVPERWVDSLRPAKFNHNVKAFVPFGLGLYNCAGRALAVLSLRYLVAVVLHRFTFEKGPHFDKEAILNSLSSNGAMQVGSMHLVVRERRTSNGTA